MRNHQFVGPDGLKCLAYDGLVLGVALAQGHLRSHATMRTTYGPLLEAIWLERLVGFFVGARGSVRRLTGARRTKRRTDRILREDYTFVTSLVHIGAPEDEMIEQNRGTRRMGLAYGAGSTRGVRATIYGVRHGYLLMEQRQYHWPSA